MTTTPRTTGRTSPAPHLAPSPGARERNPRGQGGRLRADILTAATDLLDESGTEESVTLRAVARRAGISAPAIYGHFADRQAILLAVVQGAFAELHDRLRAAAGTTTAGTGEDDPVARLHRVCAAYLDFAATRPQRYRVMFGGLWNTQRALEENITTTDLTELGQEALDVLVTSLQDCVDAARSTSSDPRADAIALWLGLHGLAHQRVVTAAFPWPADITARLVVPLAHLTR